jgi:hypothetical protein
MLLKSMIALAGAGGLLCACADDPRTADTGIGGAVVGPAIAGAIGSGDHRQYYDERSGRYYYFDPSGGGYFWEDGSPR